MKAPLSIVLAGGGTGGHVFPMIAVADALRSADPSLCITFVGTDRGLESRLVPDAGYDLRLLHVAPMLGGGAKTALAGAWHAALALPKAYSLLSELKPSAVFSVGGYAAGPLSLVARLSGIPVALLEPNSVPGLANRLIAPWVARVYTAFPAAERYFASGKVRRLGVPLRGGFGPMPYRREPGRLRVLVLGGSQGARSLNQAVPDALVSARTPLDVVHQTGPDRVSEVSHRYEALGTRARVVPFIDDMPRALTNADLVIGRAGASALSELCAIGRPAILVPYPYAAGDHQALNAQALVQDGAAVSIAALEATSDRLAQELDRLAFEPGKLEAMAARAAARGAPDAARRIAGDLLALAKASAARRSRSALAASEVI